MLKNVDVCIVHAFLLYFAINSMAFENDIPLKDDEHKQMSEQGRSQYQLIKEKGTLPKYGACFKAALKHIDKGCRYLNEDTQSDIALHITNCFLQMSGHETYNCELDKKPNLRGICINSMSDRAFNVYTEFYTHTQNICWFLRGQIWHETISENTYRMGRQLAISVEQQQDFNRLQKESMELQVTMLEQGRFLERVLDDVANSTKGHQQLLKVVGFGMSNEYIK
ncbi:uncharacterized protein LOC109537806 isoform X2 [Dendroctonus ponderosae]|uniref:uncharacterized protein LOC109537806 isoform X2 n=1 Tax=Dendroctonus ponderosae TaxID=77166 RepID=UPI0020357D26|nr:uncharacterized protein LOC109537806 isoform X2 [Dendroctonus ponderosae]